MYLRTLFNGMVGYIKTPDGWTIEYVGEKRIWNNIEGLEYADFSQQVPLDEDKIKLLVEDWDGSMWGVEVFGVMKTYYINTGKRVYLIQIDKHAEIEEVKEVPDYAKADLEAYGNHMIITFDCQILGLFGCYKFKGKTYFGRSWCGVYCSPRNVVNTIKADEKRRAVS